MVSKYDNVIYNRFDLFISNDKDYSVIKNICSQYIPDNVIYIPTGCDHGGINDRMAIGNINTMTKYLSLYDSLHQFVRTLNVTFHPETLLLQHLKTENIKVERFDLKCFLHKNRHQN